MLLGVRPFLFSKFDLDEKLVKFHKRSTQFIKIPSNWIVKKTYELFGKNPVKMAKKSSIIWWRIKYFFEIVENFLKVWPKFEIFLYLIGGDGNS